jgi:hypothetical protein
MEHRYGMRYRVNLEVYVDTCQGTVALIGRLTEVSVSGGFVKTHLPGQAIALVSLRTRLPRHNQAVPNIQGYVVRRAATGVGIEWLEFAPELVRYLTQYPAISTSEGRLRGDRFAAPLMLNSLDSSELPHGTAPRTPRLDERQ